MLLTGDAKPNPVAGPRCRPGRPTTASATIVGGAVNPVCPSTPSDDNAIDSDASLPAPSVSAIAPNAALLMARSNRRKSTPGAVYPVGRAGSVAGRLVASAGAAVVVAAPGAGGAAYEAKTNRASECWEGTV
jgi:hypothetical protein